MTDLAARERGAATTRPLPSVATLLTIGALATAFVIVGVGATFRQLTIPRFRTVWAEDGQVYGQCPMTDPSPATCLVTPYDGWLQLVSRFLGAIAAALPPERFSYSVTLLAAAVAGIAAVLLARAIMDVTGSRVAAVAAAVALTLIHPAGLEVAGNITNLHWILLAASLTIVACGWLGHRIDAADGTLILLTIATSPFGLMLVAFLIVDRLLRRRLRDALLGGAVFLTVVQAAYGLISPRPPVPDLPVRILDPIRWYWDSVVLHGPFGSRSIVPDMFVALVLVAASVVLVARAIRDRAPAIAPDEPAGPGAYHARMVAGIPRHWLGPAAVAALVAAGAVLFWVTTYLNNHPAARYTYTTVALMVIAAFLALALAARPNTRTADGTPASPGAGRTGRFAIAAMALLVAVGFAQDFRLQTSASRGPDYPTAFRGAATACGQAADNARVLLSPLPYGQVTTEWHLLIPCERIGD